MMRRRQKILAGLIAVGLSLGLAGTAQATLFDRGGGMIFDDDLGITWLQDANAGAGSVFETPGLLPGFMTWNNARSWADSLVFGGFDDWRLPTTAVPDASCSGFAGQGPSSGTDCTGSEMGHLFYEELGGTAGTGILGGGADFSLFTIDAGIDSSSGDTRPAIWWSGTKDTVVTNEPYFFVFGNGNQSSGALGLVNGRAWAVRSGDVDVVDQDDMAAVPEPGTLMLFGTGLLGLMGWAARRRKIGL